MSAVAEPPGSRDGVALKDGPSLPGLGTAAAPIEAPPGQAVPAAAPVAAATATARPALMTRRRLWRLLLAVTAPSILVFWGVQNAATLRHGIELLVSGDPYWLAGAGLATAMSWPAAAVAQQGAVPRGLPFGRLFATQLAGTFANQFSPAGLGAGAVNARFLQRRGMALPAALTAVAVNTAAGVVVHVVALIALLAAFPGTLPAPRLPSVHLSGVTLTVGATALVTAATACCLGDAHRHLRRAYDVAVGTMCDGLRALRHRPGRLIQLFAGSLAVTACHVLTLFSVLHALGSGVALSSVASAYLLATTAAAFLPSPSGAGGLEAALGVVLIGVGVLPAITVAAVIGYRLMTLWLPLAPAALTFSVLVRRDVL